LIDDPALTYLGQSLELPKGSRNLRCFAQQRHYLEPVEETAGEEFQGDVLVVKYHVGSLKMMYPVSAGI
jgi:hypothetical protein